MGGRRFWLFWGVKSVKIAPRAADGGAWEAKILGKWKTSEGRKASGGGASGGGWGRGTVGLVVDLAKGERGASGGVNTGSKGGRGRA